MTSSTLAAALPATGLPPASGTAPQEPRSSTWMSGLRAGVLGANDGIVSVAGVVVGFAGAAATYATLATAGVVALVAGAASMAAGEYVSVGAQRDAEAAGAAHEEGELTNPWVAALVSAVSFTLGALLPLLTILLTPAHVRLPATAVAALAALVVTGAVSARFAQAPAGRSVVRNTVCGSAAMAVTYAAGLVVAGS